MKLSIKPAFVGIVSLLLSLSTHAALTAVDLDGNAKNGHEGVYDDVLDITWLADANLAASNTFGLVGINVSGTMDWNEAEAYVSAMNAVNGTGYLGVNTWRQTSASGTCGSPDECGNQTTDTDDELGYQFYQNFGATQRSSIISGSNTANIALFSNVQNAVYWTGTETEITTVSVVAFNFGTRDGRNGGFQGLGVDRNQNELYVWAVADGNVGTVIPIPATAWLFGSALLGLFGIRRINYL